MRLHFGLGAVDRVDAVEVRWPSGQIELFAGLKVDGFNTLKEGSGKAPTKGSN
jgi:hypothetical protein